MCHLLTCFRVKSGCSLFEEACPVPVPHEDPGLFGAEVLPSSDGNNLLLWSLRNSNSIRAANFSENTGDEFLFRVHHKVLPCTPTTAQFCRLHHKHNNTDTGLQNIMPCIIITVASCT